MATKNVEGKKTREKKDENVISGFAEELHENTEKQDKEMHVGKKLKNKEDRQLIWFFAIIILIFASFLGTYFYFQNLKTFNFAGAEWAKEDYNGLELFHGRFPIIYKNKFVANYNIFLRNDPLNNLVPTDVNIKFYPNIIISNSPDAAECSSAGRITGDLGMLLSSFPWITNVTGAVRDKKVSEQYNLSKGDCSNAKKNTTVILIQKSGSPGPEIIQDKFNKNCYIINVGECENVLAVERFMIEIVNQMQ